MIERSGYPLLIACIAAAVALYAISPYLSALFALFAVFVAVFFRDPEREIGDGVVSPADGKIDFVSGNRLEIFMRPFDCHVNRAPVGGVVESVKFFPGKKPPAFIRAGDVCRNEIVISNPDGRFKVTQIAGIFARRIVCYVKEGDIVEKGDRIGMIRFGSRVVLEVPEGFTFVRKVGETVKAGETVAVHEGIQARKPR